MFSTIEEETYSSFALGPISVTYDRNTSKHVSVGIVFSYEYYSSERTFEDGEIERDHYEFFTLMPKLTFRYGWNGMNFYHGISLGAGHMHDESVDTSGKFDGENVSNPAAHFYLFGININVGDTASLFGDFGVGVLGIINIGLAINF